jgi:putative ABC transport system permease protein
VLKLALRGLLARKLRSALTGFAVVIGVAFVAGTFVFTDTIDESFKDLFERVSKGVDVNVTAKKPVEADFGGRPQPLPRGTLDEVLGTDGVAAAEGNLQTNVSIFDKQGKRIGGQSGPSLLFSGGEDRFDPLTYVEGESATQPGTVTIDQKTADDENFELGDSILVAGRDPAKRYEIVGITKLGDQKSLGLATLVMPLSEVQKIAHEPGVVTEVVAAADDGTSPQQLKRAISSSIGNTAVVRTGEEQAKQDAADISDSLGFIKIALLVFAGVAVLVGGFLIFNTFAVTVAQRSREFALLRTLGASRQQVLSSVVVEALVIGVLASIAGILGGLVLAPALRSLMAGFGLELPSTSTVVASRTVIVGMAVGVIATLVSGLVPARRATQVDPVEAMREADTPGGRRVSRRRIVVAFVVIGLGVAILFLGLFGNASGSQAASLLGLGVVVMIFGVALLAPVLVRPLARIIGAPLARFQGLPGRLARENAERQPHRTAITASALMIGLALVVFTAIFASGLRASVNKVIDDQFGRAALIVTHDDGFSPVPNGVAGELRRLPGVTTVSPMRFDQANVRGGGDAIPASGVEPSTITKVFQPKWETGSDATLANLRDDQVLADKAWADGHDFKVGDRVRVTTPANKTLDYKLVGLYKNQAGALGNILVTNASMTRDWNQPDDAFVLVGGTGDPDTLAREARTTLRSFPVAKAQTLDQFKSDQADQVNQLLGLVFALLSLSVIVALLGIVNTLALAVYERTRELGMLRAVGMSRRQVRRMVRAEAVITALIGAVLGVVLGSVFAIIVSRPLADEGFVLSIPVGTLVGVGVLAAIAGVLAAIPPARRAAKVDVLRAVTTE